MDKLVVRGTEINVQCGSKGSTRDYGRGRTVHLQRDREQKIRLWHERRPKAALELERDFGFFCPRDPPADNTALYYR